jgi:DNA-directed RNA polymerase specialized sigma24 family protein
MSTSGSVTHWLRGLRDGDPVAAQRLWERYFHRLVGLARKKLQGARRRGEDEEDVALSAFDTFCRGAREGRFPQLADRDDLWRLLVVITARKALDLLEREGRLKRGGGRLRGESALLDAADPADRGIEQVVGDEPTPEFAAQVAEECQRLLDKLGDDELRSIAVWKMEGNSNEEIAGKLGCALATVERRLRVIRRLWEGEGAS